MNEEVKILLHLQLSYFISYYKKNYIKQETRKKIPNSTTRVSTKGDQITPCIRIDSILLSKKFFLEYIAQQHLCTNILK